MPGLFSGLSTSLPTIMCGFEVHWDFVRKWVSLDHLEGRRVVLLLALL